MIQQIREKEKLTNKFQHSENSFYKDNSKDHIRERYLKKYHQENLNKLRQNTFYEKIRAINSKHFEFNDEISHLNLDNNYKNIKKVKEILHQSKNINKEIENSKKCINMGIKKFIIEIPENRRLKSREKEKKVWY